MQTSGLNHVILTVSNTERSRAFYGDLLGFPIILIEEDPDKSFLFTSGGVQFFFFPSRQPVQNDKFSEFRSVWITCPLLHQAKKHCRNWLIS